MLNRLRASRRPERESVDTHVDPTAKDLERTRRKASGRFAGAVDDISRLHHGHRCINWWFYIRL